MSPNEKPVLVGFWLTATAGSDETREVGPDAGPLILSEGAEEILSGEQREGACRQQSGTRPSDGRAPRIRQERDRRCHPRLGRRRVPCLPRIPRLVRVARRCPCDNKGRSRPWRALGTTAPRLHRSRPPRGRSFEQGEAPLGVSASVVASTGSRGPWVFGGLRSVTNRALIRGPVWCLRQSFTYALSPDGP